jgi:NDP-sugar pyrophosphorylase family protein
VKQRTDAEYIISREPKPLGTGGAVKYAEKYLHSKQLLILNGDSRIIFDFRNYAFNLILQNPDNERVQKLMATMKDSGIEFRRGCAGGGNQLRQPYLKGVVPDGHYKNFPEVEHIHFYGYYIGNYPDLSFEEVDDICNVLNSLE